MKLSYGTQISPSPISLSMGTLRKPKLQDITDSQSEFKMSFEKFYFFEFLITMTPEEFFTKADLDIGKQYWDSLSSEQQKTMTIYDLVTTNKEICSHYLEIFNFFFVEKVLLVDNYFVLVNPEKDYEQENFDKQDIIGVINSNNFTEVLNIIKQICCLVSSGQEEKPKFKNKTAEEIYNKIQNAEKKQPKKADINMTLPNIISSVTSKHPSLNYNNVWGLTIFQLLDNFGRMREDIVYNIEWTRVAVWGDEKKTFDPSRWYKNNFDESEQI